MDAIVHNFPILYEVYAVFKVVKQTTTVLATQAVLLGVLPVTALAATFNLIDATVEDINSAIDAGALTSEQITQLYLNRIDAYDEQGPSLNTTIAINPNALETAAALDQERQLTGPRSPLHGIPVLLKDNYDTFDLPTTAGSLSLEGSIPLNDAFQTQKLRDAGAVILGKTNLHELARGVTTISSLGGQTLNPYDTTRIPGGSSGGTGAAIAANFATLGTGTDTAISIRGPASINNLVGIRPTIGLTSRDGIVPLNLKQDVGGPITRTVTDAAVMLDTLAGFDPGDPITETSIGKIPESYTESLNANGLNGTRIGIIRQIVEADVAGEVADPEVVGLMNAAIEDMKAQGAEVFDVVVPDLDFFVRTNPNRTYDRFKYDINNYLASLGPEAPVKSLTEIIESGNYTPSLDTVLRNSEQRTLTPDEDPQYQLYLQNGEDLKAALLSVLEEQNLDAFLYPTATRPPRVIGDDSPAGGNSLLSSYTGFPSIVAPAGFTSNGLPVGVELLGDAFSEPTLISLAYSYEQATMHRIPPATTPPLPGETFEYEPVPEPSTTIGLTVFGLTALGLKLKQCRKFQSARHIT